MEKTLRVKIAGSLLTILDTEFSLGAAYNAAQSIIADETKAINDQRKANRESAQTLLTECGNTIDAVKVCNSLLPVMPKGADAAERKRAQRRRDWLKARLVAVFPDWDFQTSGNEITGEWIGDAATREASELLAAVSRLSSVGAKTSMSRDEIAACIRSHKIVAAPQAIDDSTAQMLARIAEKASGISAQVAASRQPLTEEKVG